MEPREDRRRILVIDDNPAIHEDFRKILVNRASSRELDALESAVFGDTSAAAGNLVHFDIDSALQGREGCEKAQAALRDGKPFALAFVDMRMPPGWDGVETIRHLFEIDPDIQVVVCTAYSDYSWEQMFEKLGMTDRVLLLKKPFDKIEILQLAAALTEKWKLKHRAELRLNELEAMVHARTHELRDQALHDRLTGLPNRAFVLEQLARVTQCADTAAGTCALLFIDSDRFKTINDSLGHDIGDELLLEISVRLRTVLNGWAQSGHADSFAARLGGDEFVVFLDRLTDPQEAGDFAARVLETLTIPYCLKGYDVQSGASIGVTTGPARERRPEEWMRDGDLAMYRAKHGGGGRFAFFDPSMRDAATLRLNMETDLRRALQTDELKLVYQPIVTLDSGALYGFEALLRWYHPTRGLIMPGEFIQLAEDCNLIIPLGRKILDGACRQLAEWRAKYPGAHPSSISVNLSQRHFNGTDLACHLGQTLRQHNIPPGLLKVELTESAIMDSLKEGRALMEQINALGVDLHMDDFGTGYSSLNCLHGLPLKCLKIDRSFIVTMTLKRDYAAIITAIVSLAHNLDMRVIAEGVETREQAAMLQALECDMAQGFYFAKPMAVAEAEVCYANPSTALVRPPAPAPHGRDLAAAAR